MIFGLFKLSVARRFEGASHRIVSTEAPRSSCDCAATVHRMFVRRTFMESNAVQKAERARHAPSSAHQ